MALVDDVRAEIVALHDFFTGWFQGTLPQDAITQMESRLAPGFINIQPAGRVLTLAQLRDSIAQGHGASSEFRIEIEDVVIRWSQGDLVLATYVEVQHGARNSTPSQGLVLPTAYEAREWLARYGKADLQRSADDPFLDALAANTVVGATDLEEDDAHRILDWLYVRAVRDRTQCLRRWTELVRFAEAYRISTSSLLNYWGAAEPMMLCAAESSTDDRDHAADIFEALGTRPSRWHRIMQLYPPYYATEGLREDVRPWSLLDSEFRHRIEDVRREIDVAERAPLEPGDSWDLLSLHIEELRDHEWPRSAPRFYLRHDRFAALHPPRLEPRARIAEEAAQQAEQLILRTLAEEGALYDALRGEP